MCLFRAEKRRTSLWLFPVFFIMMLFLLTACNDKGRQINSMEDLCGARVGVQIGTTMERVANDYLSKNKCNLSEGYNGTPDAVTALVQGKLDVVVMDELPAFEFVKTIPQITLIESSFEPESYAAIVNKDKVDLLKKINTAIEEIKKEGMFSKLRNAYVLNISDYHYEQKVKDGPVLTIASSPDFPPYEYYENNQIVGMEIELARMIADKLHMRLEIESMEFDSIINAVSSGKVDVGFSGFSRTEERAKVVNFTDKTFASRIYLIVPNNNASSFSIADLKDKFYNNFIKESRWKMLVNGLGITLIISVFSAVIGLVGGTVMAIIRAVNYRNGSFKILNMLIKLYINLVRGTPVMVQLLIIYYVIFASVDINKIFVAIIAFGFNSMAYTAEIIRGGIKAIPNGQYEAGYSLGFKLSTTMRYIILPQAFKNVLPSLANEGISLIKETSICGYIGLMDLTRGGVIIRNITFEAFLPLLAVALIYFIIIGSLSFAVSILERRLKKNER